MSKMIKGLMNPDISSLSIHEKIKLARNPNTSVESLKVLATDENFDVRCCVAQHPNTPVESLKVLATDEDPDVRYCVARHPNATEIVKQLVLMTDSKRMDT